MRISGACWRARRAGSRSVNAEATLASRELDPQERLDWLRLCRTETIGPVSFYALLRRFGSARGALEMVPQLARRGERSKTVTPSLAPRPKPSRFAPARGEAGLLGRAGLSGRAR